MNGLAASSKETNAAVYTKHEEQHWALESGAWCSSLELHHPRGGARRNVASSLKILVTPYH